MHHSAIYRVIELSEGWEGPVITTEWYFSTFSKTRVTIARLQSHLPISPKDLFDGAMIALAMTVLNVFHPGYWLLPRETVIYGQVPKGSTVSLIDQVYPFRTDNNAGYGGDYELRMGNQNQS